VFVKFGLEKQVARKFYFTQKFFLQERRVDFFGRCFAVPWKLSCGPQFENHCVKGSTVRTRGSCNVQIDQLDRSYDKVNMLVMDNLMWDVIVGREFLREHKSVIFEFGGPKCPLNLNSLDVLKGVMLLRIFGHLTPDCKPVASKSRNCSPSDRPFIATQTAQMLRGGIIESSTSP